MNITPSHIIEYLFCPRYIYFEYVLAIPQYEEKYYKVIKGRRIHDDKTEQNKEYLRKKIGAKDKFINQYLANDLLRGIVDEVLLLDDDSMSPLDYKFAFYNDKIYDTYKTQLYCYAWLIEENYNKPVNKGYLVYVRSKNKLIEIPIYKKEKEKIKKCANEIFYIIDKNFYPKSTGYKKKCVNCTYKNICTR